MITHIYKSSCFCWPQSKIKLWMAEEYGSEAPPRGGREALMLGWCRAVRIRALTTSVWSLTNKINIAILTTTPIIRMILEMILNSICSSPIPWCLRFRGRWLQRRCKVREPKWAPEATRLLWMSPVGHLRQATSGDTCCTVMITQIGRGRRIKIEILWARPQMNLLRWHRARASIILAARIRPRLRPIRTQCRMAASRLGIRVMMF